MQNSVFSVVNSWEWRLCWWFFVDCQIHWTISMVLQCKNKNPIMVAFHFKEKYRFLMTFLYLNMFLLYCGVLGQFCCRGVKTVVKVRKTQCWNIKLFKESLLMTSLCVSTRAIHAQFVPMEFAHLRLFYLQMNLKGKKSPKFKSWGFTKKWHLQLWNPSHFFQSSFVWWQNVLMLLTKNSILLHFIL